MIIGNWKMNKTIPEAFTFLKKLPSVHNPFYLAVPFTCLRSCYDLQIPSLIPGTQNISSEEEGAFTGEISPSMAIDAGARFSLIGHSERRRYFPESPSVIARKIALTLRHRMTPVLCLGESAAEREAGETKCVLRKQLSEALVDMEKDKIPLIVLAYEPVWAIGTGDAATPQMAQEAAFLLRECLEENYSKETAKSVSILYGGSVTPSNAGEIFEQSDIDGVLVGGASLKPDTFYKIIELSGDSP